MDLRRPARLGAKAALALPMAGADESTAEQRDSSRRAPALAKRTFQLSGVSGV
jgi:hypothetical protein